MKKHCICFSLASLMLISFVTFPEKAYGQDRKSFININVGGGIGHLTDKITGKVTTTYSDGAKEEKTIGYNLNYDIIPHAFVDVEYILDGFVTMLEAKYETAKFVDYEDYTDRDFLILDPVTFGDASIYSGNFYFGVNLFHGKRFQMPLLVGVGLKFINGAPINSLYFDFGYKARAKFYITNHVGLFAGIAGCHGIANTNKNLDNPAPRNDHSFDLAAKPFYAEAGLTFMIGRKK